MKTHHYIIQSTSCLTQEVSGGAGAPPGEEHRQSNSVHKPADRLNSHKLQRPLLLEDLHSQLGNSGGAPNQTTEVGSALVGKNAGVGEEGGDGVGLNTRADEVGAPEGDGRGGLRGAEELLLAVGGAGLLIGFAEDGGEDGHVGDVGEDGAQSDGGGLNGGVEGEVVAISLSASAPSPYYSLPSLWLHTKSS